MRFSPTIVEGGNAYNLLCLKHFLLQRLSASGLSASGLSASGRSGPLGRLLRFLHPLGVYFHLHGLPYSFYPQEDIRPAPVL